MNGVSNYVFITFFSADIAVHACCHCSADGSSFLSSELMGMSIFPITSRKFRKLVRGCSKKRVSLAVEKVNMAWSKESKRQICPRGQAGMIHSLRY
jgi:hypothetical protein